MRATTTCDRGAIVLVRFVFADETGAKRRSALILSTDQYHAGRREVLVAAITSNVDRLLVGDHRLAQWRRREPDPRLNSSVKIMRVPGV